MSSFFSVGSSSSAPIPPNEGTPSPSKENRLPEENQGLFSRVKSAFTRRAINTFVGTDKNILLKDIERLEAATNDKEFVELVKKNAKFLAHKLTILALESPLIGKDNKDVVNNLLYSIFIKAFANIAEKTKEEKLNIPHYEAQPFLVNMISFLSKHLEGACDQQTINKAVTFYSENHSTYQNALKKMSPDQKIEINKIICSAPRDTEKDFEKKTEVFEDKLNEFIDRLYRTTSKPEITDQKFFDCCLLEKNRYQDLYDHYKPLYCSKNTRTNIYGGVFGLAFPTGISEVLKSNVWVLGEVLSSFDSINNYITGLVESTVVDQILNLQDLKAWSQPLNESVDHEESDDLVEATHELPRKKRTEVEEAELKERAIMEAPSTLMTAIGREYVNNNPKIMQLFQKIVMSIEIEEIDQKTSTQSNLSIQKAEEAKKKKEEVERIKAEASANYLLKCARCLVNTDDENLTKLGTFFTDICNKTVKMMLEQATTNLLPEGGSLLAENFVSNIFSSVIKNYKETVLKGDNVFTKDFWKGLVEPYNLPVGLQDYVIEKLSEQSDSFNLLLRDVDEVSKIHTSCLVKIKTYTHGEEYLSICSELSKKIIEQTVAQGSSFLDSDEGLNDLLSRFAPGVQEKISPDVKKWLSQNIAAYGSPQGGISYETIKQAVQTVVMKSLMNYIDDTLKGDEDKYGELVVKQLHEMIQESYHVFEKTNLADINKIIQLQNKINEREAKITQYGARIGTIGKLISNDERYLVKVIDKASKTESYVSLVVEYNLAEDAYNRATATLAQLVSDFDKITLEIQEKFKTKNLSNKEVEAFKIQIQSYPESYSLDQIELIGLYGETLNSKKLVMDRQHKLAIDYKKAREALFNRIEDVERVDLAENNKLQDLNPDKQLEFKQTDLKGLIEERAKLKLEIEKLLNENIHEEKKLQTQIKAFTTVSDKVFSLVGLGEEKSLGIPARFKDKVWGYIKEAKSTFVTAKLFEQLAPFVVVNKELPILRQELIKNSPEDKFFVEMLQAFIPTLSNSSTTFITNYNDLMKGILLCFGQENPSQIDIENLKAVFLARKNELRNATNQSETLVSIYQQAFGENLEKSLNLEMLQREKILEKLQLVVFSPLEIAEIIQVYIPGAQHLYKVIAPQVEKIISGEDPIFKKNRQFLQDYIEGALLKMLYKVAVIDRKVDGGAEKVFPQPTHSFSKIISEKIQKYSLSIQETLKDKSDEDACQMMIDYLIDEVLGLKSSGDFELLPPLIRQTVRDQLGEKLLTHLTPVILPLIHKTKMESELATHSGSNVLGGLAKASSKELFKMLPNIFSSKEVISREVYVALEDEYAKTHPEKTAKSEGVRLKEIDDLISSKKVALEEIYSNREKMKENDKGYPKLETEYEEGQQEVISLQKEREEVLLFLKNASKFEESRLEEFIQKVDQIVQNSGKKNITHHAIVEAFIQVRGGESLSSGGMKTYREILKTLKVKDRLNAVLITPEQVMKSIGDVFPVFSKEVQRKFATDLHSLLHKKEMTIYQNYAEAIGPYLEAVQLHIFNEIAKKNPPVKDDHQNVLKDSAVVIFEKIFEVFKDEAKNSTKEQFAANVDRRIIKEVFGLDSSEKLKGVPTVLQQIVYDNMLGQINRLMMDGFTGLAQLNNDSAMVTGAETNMSELFGAVANDAGVQKATGQILSHDIVNMVFPSIYSSMGAIIGEEVVGVALVQKGIQSTFDSLLRSNNEIAKVLAASPFKDKYKNVFQNNITAFLAGDAAKDHKQKIAGYVGSLLTVGLNNTLSQMVKVEAQGTNEEAAAKFDRKLISGVLKVVKNHLEGVVAAKKVAGNEKLRFEHFEKANVKVHREALAADKIPFEKTINSIEKKLFEEKPIILEKGIEGPQLPSVKTKVNLTRNERILLTNSLNRLVKEAKQGHLLTQDKIVEILKRDLGERLITKAMIDSLFEIDPKTPSLIDGLIEETPSLDIYRKVKLHEGIPLVDEISYSYTIKAIEKRLFIEVAEGQPIIQEDGSIIHPKMVKAPIKFSQEKTDLLKESLTKLVEDEKKGHLITQDKIVETLKRDLGERLITPAVIENLSKIDPNTPSLIEVLREEVASLDTYRKEHFYQPQAKALMKLFFPNGKNDLTFIQPEFRSAAWKLFKKDLFPIILTNLVETMVSRDMMTTIVLSALKSTKETLDRPYDPKMDVDETQPNLGDDLDGVSTEFLKVVIDQLKLPSIVRSQLDNPKVLANVGKAVAATLRDQFKGEFVKENIKTALDAAIKRDEQGTPVLAPDFRDAATKEKSAAKARKLDEKELKKVFKEVIQSSISNFIRKSWGRYQKEIDQHIQKFYGNIGTGLKKALDQICAFIFIKVIGSVLSVISAPVRFPLREIFYHLFSIDDNREVIMDLLRGSDPDAHHAIYSEDLVFGLLEVLTTAFTDKHYMKKEQVQNS